MVAQPSARKRNASRGWVLALAVVLAGAVASSAAAATAQTRRVSLDSAEAQVSGPSYGAALSATGRFVAFASDATELVPNDTNGALDVFVRDRVAGTTRRVSVASAGEEANGASTNAALSATGRFVTFSSLASNLVASDANGAYDVFVRDRLTGTTSRVSVGPAGTEANGESYGSALSADGRFAAFSSAATNLVANDSNDAYDVFVRDRVTGVTRRVSVSSTGVQANGPSGTPSLSASGRFVTFPSLASNLVPNDTNDAYDVFVRDRRTGRTRRVSVSSAGAQANGASSVPVLSGTGRLVVFSSVASNLARRDTNAAYDVFVHDRATGRTHRLSVSSAGSQANGQSSDPVVSGNGRFVVFISTASNLVRNDDNETMDVFLRDRLTRLTRRVSVNSRGTQANNFSTAAALSANGRFVAFASDATNLVPNDTNGHRDVFVRGPLW